MTMIRKRTGIAPLAISILLFAAFAASSGDESSNEIRDLLIPKDFNSNPQHKAMRELLERIAREHPDMDTKSLKEIIFQLGNKGFTERRLVLLLESRHYYGTIYTFKSIWATVHDGHHESSSYDVWRYYLKTIGGYLFFSSAEQIHKSFKAINPTKNIFFETDLVFYYTFSLDKASIKFGDDIERGLAPKLKSFDFINDDYDAIRMLGAIRMIMNHDWNAARGFGLFKQFMLQQCKKFQQDEKLTYMIECIDIAKYFGMNCSFDRAILLVRYKRLCSDLTKPDTSKLMEANFERQLKRKGSQGKCNSFWCLDRLIEIVAKPK